MSAKNSSPEWMGLLSLGAEMFSALAVGGILGWFVDAYFSSLPIGLIIGLCLGAGSAVQVFRRRVFH